MRKEIYLSGFRAMCLGFIFTLAASRALAATIDWQSELVPPSSSLIFPAGVLTDSKDNVLVAGTQVTNNTFPYLVKYAASNGAVLWQKFPLAEGQVLDFAEDAKDRIFITGTTSVAGEGLNVLVAALSPNGKLLWQIVRGGSAHQDDVGKAIAVDGQGDVIVTGSIVDDAGRLFAAKYRGSDGAVLWETIVTGGVTDLALDRQGNAYITGYSGTVKLAAADGHVIWRNPDGKYLKIHLDQQGDVVVAGDIFSSFSEEGGNLYNLKVVKLSGSLGVKLWGYILEGPLDSHAIDLGIDSHDDVFVTGYAALATLGYNDAYYTAKLQGASGKLIWDQFMSAGSENITAGLVVTKQDDVVVTGLTRGQALYAKDNYFTIGYAGGDGTVLDAALYRNPGADSVATGITIDSKGQVIVTGTSPTSELKLIAETGLTIKYRPFLQSAKP